jgi:acyl carrier protein
MTTDVSSIILRALEEVNSILPPENQIPISTNTLLSSGGRNLDSLGLINLILEVEKEVEDQLGVLISLYDEKAMIQENNPFKSVQTLSDYVEKLIKEKKNTL